MTTKPPLTDAQDDVLGFLKTYSRTKGYQPTVREIGAWFGITSPNGVLRHLRALERKGYIERAAGLARAIRIVR